MPGPPPKRSDERRRRNDDGIEIAKVNLDELIKREVQIPVPPMTTRGYRWFENQDDGRIEREECELDEPVPAWEPLTRLMWESFTRSGQAIWYEPTDWATAYMLCEVLDRWLKPQDVKVGQIGSEGAETGGGNVTYIFDQKIVAMPGGVLTSILKALTALMATEGDRRRLRIELERRGAVDAALSGPTPVSITQKRDDAFAAAAAAKQVQEA